MSTERIETFSDGVFAIAITLLVLEIRPPEDTHNLAHQLGELWPSDVAYVVSFLLIGLVWANHHTMFQHIVRADRMLLFLNVLLPLNVAFLPFPTAVMANAFQDGADQKAAVVFYGATHRSTIPDRSDALRRRHRVGGGQRVRRCGPFCLSHPLYYWLPGRARSTMRVRP